MERTFVSRSEKLVESELVWDVTADKAGDCPPATAVRGVGETKGEDA